MPPCAVEHEHQVVEDLRLARFAAAEEPLGGAVVAVQEPVPGGERREIPAVEVRRERRVVLAKTLIVNGNRRLRTLDLPRRHVNGARMPGSGTGRHRPVRAVAR